MADGSTSRSPHRARTIALITGGALVLLAIAYALVVFLTSRAMPSDATVAGVDIGGMSEGEAVSALESELTPRSEETIVVRSGEDEAEIDPVESGIAFDPAATARQGVERSWEPRVVWDRLFGDHDYAPVLVLDDEELDPVLAGIAEDFTTEPEDASLAFDGTDTVVEEGTSGVVVSGDAVEQAIAGQWLRSEDPVVVDVPEVEPDITTEEARTAEEEIAAPAVSDDVVIEATEESDDSDEAGETSEIVVDPEIIAETLSFEAEDGALSPVFDEKELKSLALDANPDVGVEAEDASFRIVDGSPEVVPSESGISVDSEEFAEAVLPALTSEDRGGSVTLQEAEPEFTTEDAEEADVDEVISDFSTTYASSPNRDTNLRVASESVSGTVILPGEQFSLNETLGERTAANGYKPAGVIESGQMKEDYGGGVSQVSTTLFNAAYFAGFQLDEHRAHSRYISRYPEGRESTLDWTSIDLAFTNTSETPVVLDMYLDGGEVHARVFGVKTVDVESSSSERFAYTSPSTIRESGPSCTPQSPGQGWSITISRTTKDHDTGEVIDRDEFTTVYRPVNRVICE